MLAGALAPDVCLLDIGLPDMDGTELARCLRSLPATADAVLIAVTGYGQDSDRSRTMAAGFDHHLVKPLDTNQLFAILDHLGSLSPLRAQGNATPPDPAAPRY